ncbi:ATP-binding protein [Flavobacterium alkalisoli]|uniref:ATP-binding protein n=1 Tax=Flavobacterium alkalisoli TaxID=2602769 RepID=UPI001F10FACD|nr:ATP-binding protein [Flavobacterium alkalisoli]
MENSENKVINLTAEVRQERTFITISDTGMGVDKEIEDKIFLPFFTTRKDGASIGLTLSKNIIDAHGGHLQYKSSSEGSSFSICLV